MWRWNGGGFLSGGWVYNGGKQGGLKLHGLMEMIVHHAFECIEVVKTVVDFLVGVRKVVP